MNDVDEFIEHFGKKGMRWGVRNNQKSSSRVARVGSAGIKFISRHPKSTIAIAAGAAAVGGLLLRHGSRKVPVLSRHYTEPFLARYGDTIWTTWSGGPGPKVAI